MPKKDVTSLVQRLEAFEDRAKVRIEAVSAFLSDVDDDGEQSLHVRGEVHAVEGTSISNDISLELTVYDPEGRVVETSSDHIWSDSFFAFHTFDLSVYVTAGLASRIRLIPKAEQ